MTLFPPKSTSNGRQRCMAVQLICAHPKGQDLRIDMKQVICEALLAGWSSRLVRTYSDSEPSQLARIWPSACGKRVW